MSLLVDTGVWSAYLHEDDEHHEHARAIVAACVEGRHGRVVATRDVVVETLTLLLARGLPRSAAREFAALVGLEADTSLPQLAAVLDVGTAGSREAWRLFRRHYEDKGLSFTDCTSLATVRRKGIDALASFDEGFDGLVERISTG